MDDSLVRIIDLPAIEEVKPEDVIMITQSKRERIVRMNVLRDFMQDPNIVKLTGDQTITGKKTFSTIPELPASDPTDPNQAVRKAYVDAVLQGLDPKASCKAATTANITLSGTQTIDGIAVAAGDRVLVKNQTTASANGIYVVATAAWTRATDFSAGKVTPGAFIFIEEGTVNADTGWVLSTNGAITVGTTALAFTQFSAAGVISVSTDDNLSVVKTGPDYKVSLKDLTTTAGNATTGATQLTAGTNSIKTISQRLIDNIAHLFNNKANATAFIKSGTGATAGLVPNPGTTAGTTKYLREDATWAVPTTGEKPTYTYCVDSNDKLADWANNVKTGGQDYTVVYVAPGEWSLTKAATGGNSTATNPRRMIDCYTIGTKKIFGSLGSKLTLTDNGSASCSCGIFGGTDGIFGGYVSDFSITDLCIDFTGNGTGYGFHTCNNLTNCIGSGTGTSGYGFYKCNYLSNCTGTGNSNSGNSSSGGYGFYDCNRLSNCTGTGNGNSGGSNGYGFHTCNNLTNCIGTGNSNTNGVISDGYGFHTCNNLTNCYGSGSGSTTSGTGYSFYKCNYLSNCTGYFSNTSNNGYGFHTCNNLTNCIGSSSNTYGNYYGFYNCRIGFGCKGSQSGCYMSESGTTGAWSTGFNYP